MKNSSEGLINGIEPQISFPDGAQFWKNENHPVVGSSP